MAHTENLVRKTFLFGVLGYGDGEERSCCYCVEGKDDGCRDGNLLARVVERTIEMNGLMDE